MNRNDFKGNRMKKLILVAVIVIAAITAQGCQKDVEKPKPKVEAPKVEKSKAKTASNFNNELVDFPGFVEVAKVVEKIHKSKEVSVDEFMMMAKEEGTIILDARSVDKFNKFHIRGAINLPFTEFTEASLAKTIKNKDTLVLIYCNNNFKNNTEVTKFTVTSKIAKMSLNITTMINLQGYGYKNVYQLGPLVDTTKTNLQFRGSMASKELRRGSHQGPK